MPPALPPWPAPDAPAAAPGPTTRAPAAPPSRAGPPPRRAPAPPPSTPRPCDWSTARRPPAAPPAGAAACRAAPASGSSVSSRCAVAGRRARPGRRRCTAPAASRPTAPRTRSSRPPRPPRGPSPAARSPGRAGPSGRPPRRGTAPPAPPRSSVPPPPPRIRLPQAKAPGYRLRHPAGTITEHISRKPYHHCQAAVGRARPRLLGSVPVQLHAVAVRVAQVERLAHAVVAGPVQRDVRVDQPAQGVGQRRPGRVQHGEVVEPRPAGRRGRRAAALPRVQPDVVVVAAGRDEHGLLAVALRQPEAEHAAVEGQRAVEVGDLEVDVADPGPGIDRAGRAAPALPRGG